MHDTHTCNNVILWYRDVFGLTTPAATTLHNVQMLKDKDTLSMLDNSITDNICWLICQDSSQPVAEVAVTRLKLLSFWINHQDQTLREVGIVSKPLMRTTLLMINGFQEQKRLEDAWASENKEPNYTAITLDTSSATKACERVKTVLTRSVWGTTGAPIVYVIRHQLIPESKGDYPPFREDVTKYTSVDQETIARAPILTNKANFTQDYKALMTNGPFVTAFKEGFDHPPSVLLSRPQK
jgi:hypothetical protein